MIRLIKPYISFAEVAEELEEIFNSGWFTKGKFVNGFIQEIKKYTNSSHAFLTTSATTALTMCLKILKIERDDEVIVSDFSFPATANVVEDIGAIPIFADVNLTTFNMNPEQLENKITEKTKAVIFVDALGNPSGIDEIKKICKNKNIPLIEDAACAIGSSENGIKCGNIADMTCFSFHPRKLLTTGEGGAITTNNDEYAELLSIATIINGKFDFVEYGYNYRLSEIQCLMGIKQLIKLDNIVLSRNEIRKQFVENLSELGYTQQVINKNTVHNVQSLVFKIPKNVSRDDLINYLKLAEVESTLGTYSISSNSYYKNKYKHVQVNANFLENNTITLPCK